MTPRVLRPLQPTPVSPVSIGIPVRDGAASLEVALRSIVDQTHKNLEIVISDNASTDGTAEICQRFARADSRIKYFRQPTLIPANDNFRFVFEQCHSDWFMWASHDDVWDTNYVEVLLSGFASNPDAAIVFTDTKVFSDHSRRADGVLSGPARSTRGVPFPERHSVIVENGAAQFYGLYRSEVLRTHRWPKLPTGHDWLILHWAASFGDLVHVPGSTFWRYEPSLTPRAAGYMREYHWLKGKSWMDQMQHLPDVRWALQASRELADARNAHGLATRRRDLFPMLCFLHHGGAKAWGPQLVYWNAPPTLRSAWHRLRGLLASAKSG